MVCRRVITCLLFFYLMTVSVYSQEIPYRLDESNSFIQTLTWQEVLYSQEYTITVEKQSAVGIWSHFGTYTSSDNHIELSLLSGEYRYNISVTNVLNKVEPPTGWYNFTVLKAVQPVVESLENSTVYISKENDGIIEVEVRDVFEDTIFQLEKKDGSNLYGTVLSKEGNIYQVKFDMQDIERGEYTLSIINPGGLNDSTRQLSVREYGDKIAFTISAGYSLSWLVSSGNISPYLPAEMLPLVGVAKIGLYPFSGNFGNLGFQLSAFVAPFKQEQDTFNLDGLIIPASLNLAYRYPIVKDKLFFGLSLGGGLVYMHNMKIQENNTPEEFAINVLSFAPSASLSFQYRIVNKLYADLSLDYLYSMYLSESYAHLIMPSISVGWEFGNSSIKTRTQKSDAKIESNDGSSYLNISAGYSYAFFPPIENTLFSDYDFPTKNISARAKVGYFPFVSPSLGALGFELSAYMFSADFTSENTNLQGIIVPATLNLAYHKPIGRKFLFALHFGAGATFFTNFAEEKTNTSMQNAAGITGLAGLAGQFFVTDHFFIELGADYMLTYFLDNDIFHTIVPTLSLGYQFN